ncbi:MAG: radical SAM protein [Candidatus Omnitrophica bacterium]|nr:radical SAM protein [Candidatus Omnitrophota bacterium]
MKSYASWYESVYPQLTNNGLWLRGGELNTLPAEEYAIRPFRILFVRLSTYRDVASSFTHLLLYKTAAEIPGIFPDLAYLPPDNDRKIFDRDNVPWLIGTATKYGPPGFDMIAFSDSIIQEIINIPHFLRTGLIPLGLNNRLGRDDIPLVVMGGNNAPHATALAGPDPLVDGIFTGRDITLIRKFLEACRDNKKRKSPKAETLDMLAKTIPCFYRPDRLNAGGRASPPPPAEAETVSNAGNEIVMYEDEAVGTGYLGISRGCRASCSFCAENWTRKPYGEISVEDLLKNATAMKTSMGLRNIELFSFNFNMYTDLYRLLWELIPLFKSVGLKSQRFDMIAGDPAMISVQHASGKTTISAGLEGISARLRRFLNKNLDETVVMKSFESLLKTKPRELKIFLLSTGLEEKADLAEFERFLSAVAMLLKKAGAATRVIFSITPLVKFPWTPLEFDEAQPVEAHKNSIALITASAKAHGFEARTSMPPEEYLISQILVRASTPAVMESLIAAIDETLFVYYRSVADTFVRSFLKHLTRRGLSAAKLLEGHTLEESRKKPWAFFDMAVTREALWNIYRLNKNFCEAGASLDGIRITTPSHTADEYRELIRTNMKEEVTASFKVRISERGRGLMRKYIGTALTRALMTADKRLTPYFRAYVKALWSYDEEKPVWMTGDDIITLSWLKPALPLLKDTCNERDFAALVNREMSPWGAFISLYDGHPAHFRCEVDSPFPFEGLAYFRARGIKYTLVKRPDGTHDLLFTKDSIKKDIVRECETRGNNLTIVPGKKFIADEFLKEAFTCPGKNDWIRIKIDAREL